MAAEDDHDDFQVVPVVRHSPEVVRARELELDQLAEVFARATVRASTRVRYQAVAKIFAAWCAARGYQWLPADDDTLKWYALHAVQVGFGEPNPRPIGLSALTVHLAAIKYMHRVRGLTPPSLPKDVWAGIQKNVRRPPHKKRWLSAEQLAQIVETLPPGLRSIRDKALLLIAYESGGRRRSEMVSMRVEDLSADPEGGGFVWRAPQTKTSDETTFTIARIGGDLCPAEALEQWLQASRIRRGWVFRQVDAAGTVELGDDARALWPNAVSRIVKAGVARLGLSPRDYGAHSLRSGFVTQSLRDKVPMPDIMAATKHSDIRMIAEYGQSAGAFDKDSPVLRAALQRRARREARKRGEDLE